MIEPRFIQGFGIAFFFTPLITIILSGLPPERVAAALGLANFCRILGGSFGTSISITLWDRREAFHQTRLVEYVNTLNPLSNEAVAQLQSLGFPGLKSYGTVFETLINQAFMMATNDIFWLSGSIFAGLFFIVWFAKPPFSSGKGIAVE